MSPLTDTWLPFAVRRPGPPSKQGYSLAPHRNLSEIEGEVKHSAEGGLNPLFGELDRLDRRASWHFSIGYDGVVYQHYPLEAITWHCGVAGDRSLDTSLIGNATLIGEEHEGGGPNHPGEPLTGVQERASIALSRAIREICPHVGAAPPALRQNLWEHNWLSQTSCPSGRIPWDRILAALQEDEPMKDEDKAWVLAVSGDHGGIKLLKGSAPTIYMVRRGKKAPFPGGPAEFVAVGFQFEDVQTVPDGVLAKVPDA